MVSINALKFDLHSEIGGKTGYGRGCGYGDDSGFCHCGNGNYHGSGNGDGYGDGKGDIYGHGDSQRDYGCFDNGYGDAEGYDGG